MPIDARLSTRSDANWPSQHDERSGHRIVSLERVQTLIDSVLRSGLLAPAELQSILAVAPPELPLEERAVAEYLVSRGHLTSFQSEKLLLGVTQGFLFGAYRVLDRLGRGATSGVYLALDVRTGRHQALKVLSSN